MYYEKLKEKIEKREAILCIIGMGYVGLPLSLSFCEEKYHVIGFDVNPNKINSLMQGVSYISHIPAQRIADQVKNGYFKAVFNPQELKQANIIFICVPTPLQHHHEPDISYIQSATCTIRDSLQAGQLIILESTSYPGTTKEVVVPILEQTGLKAGQDFFVAFSPEREDPGNKIYSTRQIPKIIGGTDEKSGVLANLIYSKIVRTVPVSNSETAEAVKLTENIFRWINIGLVNELKMIYQKMDIDIWEVIDAAKTKPFGFMPFYPSPGLGGHCIPIVPFYLSWKAKEYGYAARFIELAGEINDLMPRFVLHRLMEELNLRKKSLNGSKILLLGAAYKRDIEDFRESPVFPLYKLLLETKAVLDYYDPFIPEIPKVPETGEMAGCKSIVWDIHKIPEYDAVVIITDHSNIDYQAIAQSAQFILDTRNATKNVIGDCRSKIAFA